MKYIFTIIITVFAFSFSMAQASEVAHETIMAQGIEQVKFDLGTKNIEVKRTKGSRIIVESSVKISIPNANLLKYLVKSGRYQLETSIDAATSTLTISRKKNTNVLIVKGKECEEELTYTVLLPEHIKFAGDTSVSASNQ
jgi:predicted adenine nucleotide alpha hydrolase (AANH) superfamily ATPase